MRWPRQAPLQFPATGYDRIPVSTPVEEECYDWYSPNEFYPARIGEVLNDQYQLVGKLGHGGSSTVWLARDLFLRQHVTVKIALPEAILLELPMLRRLPITDHLASPWVRRLRDEFSFKKNETLYHGLVFDPCLCSLRDFRLIKAPHRALPPLFVKPVIRQVLYHLDYLHNDAKLIHTDINDGNIFFAFDRGDRERLLEAAEQQEMLAPIPRKVDGDRVIYRSRSLLPEERVYPGPVMLGDFGSARAKDDYDPFEPVSPSQYRAPEIIFRVPWDEKVDIWCLGMMLFDTMGDRNLINSSDGPNGEPSPVHMFLQMIALFGHPPLDFLERIGEPRIWEDLYNRETGEWLGKYTIPDRDLESTPLIQLEGEDRRLFFEFVRRMLAWRPEDRSSAGELLKDKWLDFEC